MTATAVPRRHRRAQREAEQNLEDHWVALEGEVHAYRPPTGPPVAERVALRDRPLLPVRRPWMHDPASELRQSARVAGNRVAHHGIRLLLGDHPRTFACAAGRGARRAYAEARDYVKMPKRQAVLERLVAEGEPKRHAKMAASYQKRRRARTKKLAGTAGGILLALLAFVAVVGPVVAAAVLLTAGPAWLAFYGRRTGPAQAAPVKVDARPVQKIEARLSADAVHRAFHESGIPGVVIVEDPHRSGPGFETVVRIPPGRDTFDTAAGKRAVIAGNLEVTRERLFLDPVKGDRGSEKLVRVWRADTDPMAGPPPPHPLLDPAVKSWDLWTRGWPLGVDVRGRPIHVPVVDTPFGVVGAKPGAGKTFTMFGLGVAVGLDALFDLDIISFKPSDDFKSLKPLVTACGGTYICGADADAFQAFHRYLVRMRRELTARYARLGQLPIEAVPEGKLTRELAADPRMGMRPRIALCDEIQTPLQDKVWGPRILDELIELARTARALSFWMLFGMQFVEADTVKQLVRLLGFRFALSVARWEDSKGILGGAHTPGVADASEIPLSRKGVGIVAGAEDDPTLGILPAFQGRTYGIDRVSLARRTEASLAWVRAGQQGAVQLAKAGDPASDATRARLRSALNGDEAMTCAALGERLELGVGAVAAKKLAEQARAAGIEPRRDTTGRATGSREALYIHRDQLS